MSLPFLYQLQNATFSTLSTMAFHAAVIDMDESHLTAQQVATLESQGKTLFTYISIGEAEDYRDYWINGHWSTAKPSFVLSENPDWHGNFRVKFWDPAWQQIAFAQVDKAISLGYNGMYLDIVDGYEVDVVRAAYTGADIRQDMINFVIALSQHAKAINPNFMVIPQNAVGLLALNENNPGIPNTAYLRAIDGIGVEDLWYNDNKPSSWTSGDVGLIQNAINAHKFVLATSYPTVSVFQDTFVNNAINAGYIPFVGNRDLNGAIASVDNAIEARMAGHNITTPWDLLSGRVVDAFPTPSMLHADTGGDTHITPDAGPTIVDTSHNPTTAHDYFLPSALNANPHEVLDWGGTPPVEPDLFGWGL